MAADSGREVSTINIPQKTGSRADPLGLRIAIRQSADSPPHEVAQACHVAQARADSLKE
jgi:hypothetical protein